MLEGLQDTPSCYSNFFILNAPVQKSSHSEDFEGTAEITYVPNWALGSADTILIWTGICTILQQCLNLSIAFKVGLYDTIKAKDCLCSVDLCDWGPVLYSNNIQYINHLDPPVYIIVYSLFSKQELKESESQ